MQSAGTGQGNTKIKISAHKKNILENQISQMENSMLEMERFYESVSHVKHDIKNKLDC